jgi:hypothetical protein
VLPEVVCWNRAKGSYRELQGATGSYGELKKSPRGVL